MANNSLVPSYFRIDFAGDAPTNFTTLAAPYDGFVDNVGGAQYNELVTVVGTQANPSVSDGDSILLNKVFIKFTTAGGLNLSGIISTINLYTSETGVFAHSSTVATYLTLQNAPTFEGTRILVEETDVGGVLTALGLTVESRDTFPSQVGGAFTNLDNNDDVVINGVTVTFTTGGGLNQAGACATINALTYRHNVIAYRAANRVQLASANSQPFNLAEGTADGALAQLGFSAGSIGGNPATYALSVQKERAVMRWQNIVANLTQPASPIFVGEFVRAGNLVGSGMLTTLSWTVGYDRPHYLVTEDETSPGDFLYGIDAVKRFVARGLIHDQTMLRDLYNPTLSSFGSNVIRPNPLIPGVYITAGKLDTSVATIEGNITVTKIPNV